MWLISFTREISHFEMSLLKDAAPRNMAFVSVTLDTSHSPIGPCGPSEQSPSGANFRQIVTAFLSSAWNCGENRNWPAQEFGEIVITRAKKMTWRYNSEGVDGCYYITSSLCLCLSARLTRMHSQYFELMSCNSLGTSREWSCVMNTVSMEIMTLWVNVTWRRVHVTSGCNTIGCLYFARKLRLSVVEWGLILLFCQSSHVLSTSIVIVLVIVESAQTVLENAVCFEPVPLSKLCICVHSITALFLSACLSAGSPVTAWQ